MSLAKLVPLLVSLAACSFDRPFEGTFEVRHSPPLQIPDNNPAGSSTFFTVAGVSFTHGLDVEVDVTHSFRGDVRIELLREANVIATLKPPSGDPGVNVVESYTVSPETLRMPYDGKYLVRISDAKSTNTGTVNLVRLTFR